MTLNLKEYLGPGQTRERYVFTICISRWSLKILIIFLLLEGLSKFTFLPRIFFFLGGKRIKGKLFWMKHSFTRYSHLYFQICGTTSDSLFPSTHFFTLLHFTVSATESCHSIFPGVFSQPRNNRREEEVWGLWVCVCRQGYKNFRGQKPSSNCILTHDLIPSPGWLIFTLRITVYKARR